MGQDKGWRESWEANVLSGPGLMAGCIPVCWAGPAPGWTGPVQALLSVPPHLSALSLMLLTSYLPSLGIKTSSGLCAEGFFEVL